VTDGTIGVNVQGLQTVQNEHSFVVSSNVQAIEGFLSWTGAPDAHWSSPGWIWVLSLQKPREQPRSNILGTARSFWE